MPRQFAQDAFNVFPAGAGMNRLTLDKREVTIRVPRRRGDEPVGQGLNVLPPACSPQARG